MNTLKIWWHGHGTKILGVIVMLVGVAGDCLTLIQALDPKRAALWALVIGLGGAVLRRGFINSQNASLPPPDPNAGQP